jgi:pyridoxal phosphate enzyme (YggS family)
MNLDALPGNLARVRDEIARVQAHEGVSGEVTIVAVTKGHPPEAAVAAHRAGLRDLGENRVQEALHKIDGLSELPVCWHLIGHLQTNKAKHVPGRFAMVHSVDSGRVADALGRAVERHEEAGALPVLLQVNMAGEEQKSGCPPEEAEQLAAQIAGLPALSLRGLMTMAPFVDDEVVQRRVFSDLRCVRDRLTSQGLELPELSMGMTGDYQAAVAEGATILRLGTVLFGERAT